MPRPVKNNGEAGHIKRAYRKARGKISAAIGAKGYHGIHSTASKKNIMRFGKEFLTTFPQIVLKGKKRHMFVVLMKETAYESSHGVGICLFDAKAGKPQGIGNRFINVSLGFEKNTVVIESLHGRKWQQAHFEQFRELHGKHCANFLIEKIEEHARKHGFKQVKIRVPESLRWYWHPEIPYKAKKKQVRRWMENFYNGVANNTGYVRKGNFFVKKL